MNIADKSLGSENKLKSLLMKCLVSRKTVVLVFALFLLCGVFFYNDYGMSTDETMERNTSIVNYVHVMGPLMRDSEHEAVRSVANNVEALSTYRDRFYGAALQCITVFIEHLFRFELNIREVYLMRHAFVFLNYFIAGICFYLIINRRFGNGALPLLGVLAFILSPRFFGEAFYNIKDSLFFSWMVISGYFVLRWLENRKVKFCFFAAAALAVAINTRILGLSLLLLACAFAVIISIRQKEAFLRAAGRPLALFGLTLAFWILITPFLWGNPVRNIIEVFVHFMNFENWAGLHLYMGEMISRHVPWHYIPVWMGITIPIPYIAMFFAGVAAIAVKAAGRVKQDIAMRDEIAALDVDDELELDDLETLDTGGGVGGIAGAGRGTHLYDIFMAALFFCTLFGFIILRITMYEGWRHAYGIYFSFVYIAVYGLGAAIAFFKNKHIALRRVGTAAVFASFAFLFGWICVNHPYEYVFFNSIGRIVAERNFTLDYWEVSFTDLVRYVLAKDEKPKIMIYSWGIGGHNFFLPDEEQGRVIITDAVGADYYLQPSNGPFESRVAPEGYQEEASIIVDGMKISTIYKNVTSDQMRVEIDAEAKHNIARMVSNIDGGDYAAMLDDDPATRWTTGRPQQPRDFLMVEFAQPVDYDFFSFASDAESEQDYPRALTAYLSADGYGGPVMPVVAIEGGYRFTHTSPFYRFIVFEVGAEATEAWMISELEFGHITQ